ncbi:MAG: agmatine deiminase family protein [Myxococcota bacterium]
MQSPAALGFAQPIETDPHEATWVAWPADAELWRENLPAAQAGFVQLCRGIADVDPSSGRARGETLYVLVPSAAHRADAERALAGLPLRFFEIPYGDIWLRDIAPIFLTNAEGRRAAAVFRFNGWGGKYVLEHDDAVAARVATAMSDLPCFTAPFVLEGGSVDVDGQGTVLTTAQCLLNPNRNPGRDKAQIERDLRDWLGAEKTLWITEGLLNDHTDGHIDTIARFVRPGLVATMEPTGADDPNRGVLEQIARELGAMTDARGRKLEVVRIPSPGAVLDESGKIMPASYVNYYLSNTSVIVPQYGVANDARALVAIAALHPERHAVGAEAKAILSGGGAFHCITQQLPKGGAR